MTMNTHNRNSSRARLPIFRRSARKHDALLINSLTVFNFRPPIILEFPGQRRRTWSDARDSSW